MNKKATVSEQDVINNLATQIASMHVTLAMKDAYIKDLEQQMNELKQRDTE